MIKACVALICTLLLASAHPLDFPSECRKVDEYSDVYCEDQQARLDNFALLLQKESNAVGYVIVYGGSKKDLAGREPRRWEAQARADGIKHYLVDVRGLRPESLVMVDGGFREKWTVELYICPRGATLPAATPTIQPKDIKFKRGKVKGGGYAIFCG